MAESAFGVDHGNIYKLEDDARKRRTAEVAGGAAIGAGAGVGATKIHMPEHSHYDKKTRAHIASLPAGIHEVDTAMLAKKPRKLGARKQQRAYVAAMAQERPVESFKNSPVPITRYKNGVIQRDNAHSVMANAMKGRKTTIKIEDAPGYRPTRPAGEELVRRAQSRYQQRRLARHTNLSDDAINTLRSTYKEKSRIANTTKRPHGVVEDKFKYTKKKYGVKTALKGAKAFSVVAKRESRNRDVASGAAGTAGAGVLASTPVRRSAAKVDVSNGSMKAADAKKVVSPGYRPGNRRSIRTMAANLGHLENSPTKVIRYKDGSVIPFDGNHRATARLARGDKSVPVSVIEGKERPTVSAARNVYHVGQQKLHQSRMNRGAFAPTPTTGKHAGQTKVYSAIANGSKSRAGKRVAVNSTKAAMGPTKAVLRTKQGLALSTGGALLGTAGVLHSKKKLHG